MVDTTEKKTAAPLSGSWPPKVHQTLTLLTLTFMGAEACGEDHITSLGTIPHSFFYVTGRTSIILTRSCCWTGFRKMISEQSVFSSAMPKPCSVCTLTHSRRPHPRRVAGGWVAGFKSTAKQRWAFRRILSLSCFRVKQEKEVWGKWLLECYMQSLTWKSQIDPKKRFPREDKSIRLMADIKIPIKRWQKAILKKAKAIP